MIHSNRPEVILDDEDDRELVKGSHVQAFSELSHVRCSIPEESKGHLVRIWVFQGVPFVPRLEGSPESDGNSFSNESKSTQHIVLSTEHMHGASLSVANSGFLCEELGHDFFRVASFRECVNVVTIRRADVIILAKLLDSPRRDSLLSIRKVHESEDLSSLIPLCCSIFKLSAQIHILVESCSLLGSDLTRSNSLLIHFNFNCASGNRSCTGDEGGRRGLERHEPAARPSADGCCSA
mmetsp:Transcript_19075/g.30330  ORF Transcript_19075/g.30330 Transcript_19075/m.30330 type:complete len:237 (-) Transcript_19075:125-835(-)